MSLDVAKAQAILAEINAAEEFIADRGPFKVLPRALPDVPALRAKIAELEKRLRVKRSYAKAKGHDLVGDPPVPGLYDLSAVGVVEEIRSIPKGRDRALPTSTTIVRVGFPASEHLWFDPSDLDALDDSLDVAKKPKKPKEP